MVESISKLLHFKALLKCTVCVTKSMALPGKLANFLLEQYVHRVTCSSVCADHYDATNLISNEPGAQNRGLRVEHFVRPPVSLEFHFKFPLNVACVLIRPNLADGAEMKVEMFAAFSSDAAQSLRVCDSAVVKTGQCFLARNRAFERKSGISALEREEIIGSRLHGILSTLKLTEQNLKLPHVLHRTRYLKVAITRLTGVKPLTLRGVEVWATTSDSCSQRERDIALKGTQQPLITIPRTGFYSSGRERTEKETTSQSWSSPIGFCVAGVYSSGGMVNKRGDISSDDVGLASGFGEGLSEIRRGGEPPQLKTAECGEISPHSTAAESESFSELQTQRSRYPSPNCLSHATAASTSHHTKASTSSQPHPLPPPPPPDQVTSQGDHMIPDEFLDEITCELLVLPMLLPSGHCVDRSTLGKLAASDASFGRPPLDPFTGGCHTPSHPHTHPHTHTHTHTHTFSLLLSLFFPFA